MSCKSSFEELNQLFLELVSVCESIRYNSVLLDVISDQLDFSCSLDFERKFSVLLEAFKLYLDSDLDRFSAVLLKYQQLDKRLKRYDK